MSARAGGVDVRALLATSARVRAAVPLLVEAAAPNQRVALVGGVVRDLLRGEEPREVDVVVEGDGVAFAKRLAALTSSEIVVYTAFGTATIVSRPPVDVATARSETYAQPGALPNVCAASLEEDLARRDLTINAIAAVVAGPDAGVLLDPFGGVADVVAGQLRLLRPNAFEEDATRIVRAARYAVRLDATPDVTLVAAAKAAADGGFVALTGAARMLDALRLVFEESNPTDVIALLADWDALTAIQPDLSADPVRMRAAWALLEVDARDADRVALGLGLLAGELADAKAWLSEGGLDRASLRSALAAADAVALQSRLAGCSAADVDAACARVPIEGVVAAGGTEAAEYLARLRHMTLAVDGEDVRGVMGAEGPAIGRALIELRRARIEGSVGETRDAQLAWLASH